jgi:hypothetical protein
MAAKTPTSGALYVGLFCGLLTLTLIAMIIVRVREKDKLQEFQKNVTFENSTFDFGTALQNEKIRHQFRLLNESSNEVVVAGLRTTCSCTVTESNLVGTEIAPQSSIFVPATYDTGNRDGDVSSSVLVLVISKGSRYELEATIRGSIFSDFTIDPSFVDFGKVKPGEIVTRTISFRPKAIKSVIIHKPAATNDFFTVSLNHETNSTQAVIEFHAPPIPREQTFSDLLQFPTSSERVPVAKVYVRGEVVPNIEITPDLVIFTQGKVPENLEFSLHTTHPSRLIDVIAKDSKTKLEFATDNTLNAFQLEQSVKLSNVSGAVGNARQIQFELEVQDGTNKVETQFVSVPIKSL